jgi:signal transduction histidine kinase
MAANALLPTAARNRTWRWLLSLSGVLLLIVYLAAVAGTSEPGQAPAFANAPLVIDKAIACSADTVGDTLPGADCAWKPIELPYDWRLKHPGLLADRWFKVYFQLPSVPASGVALFFTSFNRTGELFVNGTKLGSVGAMSAPLPLNWNRSQAKELPASMLRVGSNEVEIHQRCYANWDSGKLGTLRLGNPEQVRRIWERRTFWQNQLVVILGAATGAIGLFILGVWLGRRSEALYFWFGCESLVWTCVSLDYFAAYPPLPPQLWEEFVIAGQILRTVLMFIFVLRYCGRKAPRFEAVMWIYFLGGTVPLFAHLVQGDFLGVWLLGAVAASPYFAFLLVRQGFRRSRFEGSVLAVAAVSQVLLSGYDLALWMDFGARELPFLAHFTVPLYSLVVGLILIRHFVESLNAYERLNKVLEVRVAEKAAELETYYDKLSEAKRTQALATERARIMSEMHDGIGSQLTMALSLVRRLDQEPNPALREGATVAAVLTESIEDLQLIIDSLEPVENDLLTVLGTLRYRMQDRLAKAGIQLQWRVVDLPPLPILTPHSVLSILRIIQEAFANCLKHSGASRIEVVTGLNDSPETGEHAFVSIVDNGCGIGSGREGGRGLSNMRARAASLGGDLQVKSVAGRTEILLTFPTMRLQAA